MLFVLSCPKCGHNNLRPSRRRKISEFLLVPMATPYRCRLCDHRELVFRMAVPRRQEDDEEEGTSVNAASAPVAGTEPAPPPSPAPPPAVASPTGVGEDDSARS